MPTRPVLESPGPHETMAAMVESRAAALSSRWQSTKAWIVLAIALGLGVFWASSSYFPDQLAYDMYHPWGIAQVHAQMPRDANPYVDTRPYADAMATFALATNSSKASLAENFWRGRTARHIEPTGTPLFYAVMSILPRDYDASHLAIALVQHACVALAFLLLLRLRGIGPWPALCVAFLVELTFNPFIQDVKMANMNSLQLAAFAALIHASASGALERRRWADRAFLPALALLVLFKPNIVWIAGALAAHYAVRRGARATAVGVALCVPVALAGMAIGAAYFGALHAWPDWLRYIGGHGGSLLYSLDGGNQSVAMLMAERTGGYDAYTYSLILVAAIAIGFVAVLSESGKHPEQLLPASARVLDDPWLAASLGVLMTCATAPLVWPHYFLLNLLPITWLLLRPGRPDWASGCAILSYLMQSKPLIMLLAGALHATGLTSSMMAFTWAPLLPALVAQLARAREAPLAAAAH